MELSYIWFWIGIVFLIVEILTFTFYWLSLAIWAFFTAILVYFTKDTSINLVQALLFIAISTWFALFATKYLRPKKQVKAVWLDAYIWTTHKLEKIWDDWKIKIDGVDYLVDDESIALEFWVGKKVKVLEHNSWVFKVELV